MTYPVLRGTPATWPNGPGQATDNLSALANGQAKGLGTVNAEAISLVTPLFDLILPPWKITTGSGSVSGAISRYLLLSEDGSTWPGNINPTSASDQSTALAAWLAADPVAGTAALLDSVTASAASTAYYFRWHSIFGLQGNVARYMAVVVYNQTGQAFSGTAASHSATYATDVYSNA